MRKRNNKFKIAEHSRIPVAVGVMSIGALAGLLTLAANPVAQQVAKATAGCLDEDCYTDGTKIDLNAGELVAKESSVAITINASSGNAKLSAEEGWGTSKAQGIVRQTASVVFGATDGYTIKISGNPTLKGTDSRNTIAGVTGATTLAQMRNQWGWYSADGSVDCSADGVFRGMTTTGETVASGSLPTAATKVVTMCFGAKVDGTQAGDTYSNTVTVSAVAEPSIVRTVFGKVKTMQEVTTSICNAAAVNDTAQLVDDRDGKKYWVTKLADGNCWMSQNLDLDLGSSVIASKTDGTTFTWNNSTPTTKDITAGNTSNAGTASWDVDEYILNMPTATTACANNTGLSACAAQGFVKVAASDGWMASGDPNFYRTTTYTGKNGASCSKSENSAVNASASVNCKYYDAHYLVGNYYQWNAAVAGTGGAVPGAGGSATGSVCPKGWGIPGASSNADGMFAYMLERYGVNSAITGTGTNGLTYNIALSPVFFVRAGLIAPSSSNTSVQNAGQTGRYWSSQVYDDFDSSAYGVTFDTTVTSSEYNQRRSGRSVRCRIKPGKYDVS